MKLSSTDITRVGGHYAVQGHLTNANTEPFQDSTQHKRIVRSKKMYILVCKLRFQHLGTKSSTLTDNIAQYGFISGVISVSSSAVCLFNTAVAYLAVMFPG